MVWVEELEVFAAPLAGLVRYLQRTLNPKP
jgi:hypothetical protein